jgi:hypothetical protein
VNRLRRTTLPIRLLLAAVLALCLAVRVLTPPGFMPSFATGALAIVPCPDAEGASPVARAAPLHQHMAGMAMPHMATAAPGHDHEGGKNAFHHQSCPYAAAASLSALDLGTFVVAILALIAAVPPLTRALPAFRRRATRDRPPAQGPPLPA